MTRYALVDPQGNFNRLSSNVTPNVSTKAGWKWLQCDPVTPPAFDPTSQALVGPTYTVGASSVTEVWSTRSLSAQEISDAKDAAIAAINGGGFSPIFKALFNLNNRVRVLEGSGALTVAQFKAQIKTLL